MRNVIPIEVKQHCIELKRQGQDSHQIYDEYFKGQFDNPMNYHSFNTSIGRWSSKDYPDEMTLNAGTYEGFVAHDATVQVSGDGSIVQAWIKQKATDLDPDEFIAAIKEVVEPTSLTLTDHPDAENMLEIPLFDMHWGIAFMDHYEKLLNDILNLITNKHWKRIVIPFGQDFFHNDSIEKGETTKGTLIEKVDMVRAVKEGRNFICEIIDAAYSSSDEVKVLYSPGNHDRSISWMFMQMLLERYGDHIVDDSMEFRKVITYGKNAIMITHGDSKRATPQNLAHIFPVMFAKEFSDADIREVHAGHLHCESDTDVFGVMVRRLSSANITDRWSDKEDFIGVHKRFMLFEWDLKKLKSIYYM